MALKNDDGGFQNSYYLVGTGMIRMPSHGIVYVSEGACEASASHHRHPAKESSRRGMGSTSWILRLVGNVKSRISVL